MKTSNELRQEAFKLTTEARALMEAIDGEKDREWLPEDEARHSKMASDAMALKAKADRLDEQEKLEAENREVAEVIPPVDEVRRTDGSADEQRAAAEAELASAFNDVMFYRGFSGPTQEAQRVYEERALQADIDTTGGYLVAPGQFVSSLIQAEDNITFFPSLATTHTITSSDRMEGVSLDTDVADPVWTAEIGSADEDSSLAFGGRALEPHQLTKLVKLSRKLAMVSAVGVESLVRARLSYKNATTQEAAFMTGSGAGQPLGCMIASADGITTTQDISTGNTTTEIRFDGLKACKYDMKQQYWPRVSWIFHRDAVAQIDKLKDGNGQYQWRPSLEGGQPDRLLNIPIRYSEYQQNTFTTGLYVGILGDFKHYWIARLAQIELQRLDELYARTGQIGFIARSWLDGMPVLAEAFRRVTLA